MFNRDEFDVLTQMANEAKKELISQNKDRDEYDDALEDYMNQFGDGEETDETEGDMEGFKAPTEPTIQSQHIPNLQSGTIKNNEQLTEEDFSMGELPKLDSYEELLFPGGPSKLKIETYKKQYDGYGIILVEICNEAFVFKTMNRFEYKQLITMKDIDGLLREEIICKNSVLWPENYDFENLAGVKAGIPSTLAEIIMEQSGFTKEYAIQEI